jgi:hypothetical protein
MRDAINLQDLNLQINEEEFRINSVWANEDGEMFIKLEKDEMMVNYKADKIISLLKEQNLLRNNAKVPKLCTEDI